MTKTTLKARFCITKESGSLEEYLYHSENLNIKSPDEFRKLTIGEELVFNNTKYIISDISVIIESKMHVLDDLGIDINNDGNVKFNTTIHITLK